MKLAKCWIGMVCALATAPAQGDVVFEIPPTLSGGPASDTEFINSSGDPSWQLLADNFILPSPVQLIRRVSAWAFYNENTPPASETLRVRFYDARPTDGLPGNILFEESFLNPYRVPTGNMIIAENNFDEYFFQMDLSLAILLEAKTTYWLEVVQVGDISSAFRWETGFRDLDGLAFINPFVPDWQLTNGNSDLAFQLSTIPEPSALGFFLLGASMVGRRRSRREVRRVNHRV